ARGQECEEAGRDRRGTEAGGAAAPSLDQWGGVRAAAPQHGAGAGELRRPPGTEATSRSSCGRGTRTPRPGRLREPLSPTAGRIGGRPWERFAAPTDAGPKHAPRSLSERNSSANGSVRVTGRAQGTKVPFDYKTFSWQGARRAVLRSPSPERRG